MQETGNLKFLFEPRSVAVIGASRHPEKIGHKILSNIVNGEYQGKIFPVNPEGQEILGLKVYPKITDIKEEIDLALIAVPAKFVLEVVKDCAAKKVKFVSIISSGFSEIGNIAEEEKIVAYAQKHGLRILGPNVFGLYSARAKLNATFGPLEILPGNVAILTQSGALGLALIGKTAMENLGISSIVSLGNKADLNSAELIEYLSTDSKTNVIFLYLESIKDGQKLLSTIRKTVKQKPVIILKSGRSEKGVRAAATHTGALAGNDELFNDLLRQAGALRPESLKEAMNWAKFLSLAPKPRSKNTLIITNGGGLGVLATDACEKYQIPLFENLAELKKTFSDLIPSFGSYKNPLDLTGQATAENYASILEAALKNKNLHSIVAIFCETAVLDLDKLLTIILKNYPKFKKVSKPLVLSFFGGLQTEKLIEKLKKERLPIFTEIYEAISSLSALQNYSNLLSPKLTPLTSFNVPLKSFNIPLKSFKTDLSKIKKIIFLKNKDSHPFLSDQNKKELLKFLNISTPKNALVNSLEEALRQSRKIGFPVVMKVVSPQILHKTDIGGVMLNLKNRQQVAFAYEKILENCRKFAAEAKITGIKIEEMLKPGIEVIVGAKNDPTFGPIVLFGAGGIYVEILKDLAFRSFPAGHEEILEMIKQTKISPLLTGVRNQEKKDIEGIMNTIMKLGTLVTKIPEISEIEINPLMVYEKKVKAVDLRVIL